MATKWRGNMGDGPEHGKASLLRHYADLERWVPSGTHQAALCGEPLVLLTDRERRLHKARIMWTHFVPVPRE